MEMLLEANARPGLAIQMANGQGLLPRLAAIDRGETLPPVAASAPEIGAWAIAHATRHSSATTRRQSA